MTYRILFGRFSAAVILVAANCFVASIPAFSAEGWRVVGIKLEGRVHLRQQATSRSKIVAYIPGNARGLKNLGCQGNWCKTKFRNITGWVFKRYLAPDKEKVAATVTTNSTDPDLLELDSRDMAALSEAKKLYVFNPAGRTISVYAFPSETLPIAGHLSDGVTSVEGLGACIKGWCYIRSGPLIGWLPAFVLAPATKGADDNRDTTASIHAELVEPENQNERALNTTTTTATQASITTGEQTPVLSPAGNKYYSIAGLAGEQTLPIHAKASERSKILGRIEQDENRIEGLRKCLGKWCLVRVKSIKGWIERRHLADPEVFGSQVFKISGLPLWSPLEVIDQPGEKASVVGEIPAYATGIVPIGGCDKDWCHVRYLGVAGWVEGKYLTSQHGN